MKNWSVLVSGLFFVSGLLASEGELRDPTRPANSPVSSEGSAIPGAEDGLRLDAVVKPVSGRPLAVINGETVKLGHEIRGMKLIAVRESSVVLQGGNGKETLTLTSGVEKTMRPIQTERSAVKKKPGGGA